MTIDEHSGTATFLNDSASPSILSSMLDPLWQEHPETRQRFCFPHLGDQPGGVRQESDPTQPAEGKDLVTQLEDVQRSLSVLDEDDEWRSRLLERRTELLRRIVGED